MGHLITVHNAYPDFRVRVCREDLDITFPVSETEAVALSEALCEALEVREADRAQDPVDPTTGSWADDAEELLNMGARDIGAATVRGLLEDYRDLQFRMEGLEK